MSTRIMSDCWSLQMPPTAKAILISLADNANDDGYCWPSIATISERTCFGKTAVIDAIKWLEDHGALRADRSNGRGTRYILSPGSYQQPVRETDINQSGMHTGTAHVPVRETDGTGPAGGLHRSGKRTAPVRQADTNRKEPSKEPSGNRHKSAPLGADDLVALGVPRQHAADWLSVRKAKRQPLTQTALDNTIREAEKAGMSLADAVHMAAVRGWAGFMAAYLAGQQRGQAAASSRASRDADWDALDRYLDSNSGAIEGEVIHV